MNKRIDGIAARESVQVRESNFELLRLLCMFLIVIHHLIVHGMGIKGVAGDPEIVVFFDTAIMFHINVFILISGFFGISLKLSGIYKFYSQLVFYGCVGYVVHLLVDDVSVGRSALLNSVFVIGSSPGWWFAQYYFFLLLLSPLLNSAVKAMNKPQFGLALVLMTVLNLYYSFVWKIPINYGGWGLFQFVYLYLLGRYMHLYIINSQRYSGRLLGLFALFVLFAALMGWIGVLAMKDGESWWSWFVCKVYNHPFVLLCGVFLLLAFERLKFRSKWINWIATSTFAIYLIHENSYLSDIIYSVIPQIVGFGSLGIAKGGLLIGVALVLMLCCVMIDKIRMLVMRPLDRFVVNKLKPFDERLSIMLNG